MAEISEALRALDRVAVIHSSPVIIRSLPEYTALLALGPDIITDLCDYLPHASSKIAIKMLLQQLQAKNAER